MMFVCTGRKSLITKRFMPRNRVDIHRERISTTFAELPEASRRIFAVEAFCSTAWSAKKQVMLCAVPEE
jgi:hypothetical protein